MLLLCCCCCCCVNARCRLTASPPVRTAGRLQRKPQLPGMCGEMCNVWRAVVCMTQLLWHQSPLAALAVDLPLLKHTPPR